MLVFCTYESFGLLLLLEKSLWSLGAVVGQGDTKAWKMCGLYRKISLCLVFDIVRKHAQTTTHCASSGRGPCLCDLL
jgi:hypothetical protein